MPVQTEIKTPTGTVKRTHSADDLPPATEEVESTMPFLQWPAVGSLFLWMIVPLAMTIYFSLIRYNLMNPDVTGFAKLENYKFLWEDPAFFPAIVNTVVLLGSVLAITVGAGILLAVLYDTKFFGRNVATLLVIAPFFVMPTVSALVWKNMMLHPVYGLVAKVLESFGIGTVDWFGDHPMFSVILIISWEWMPFAFLILFTSIFLLSIFAEIYTTTSGGPGTATTTLACLVYSLGLQQFDIGIASAGGLLAVILANIVAFFLVRLLSNNLKAAR